MQQELTKAEKKIARILIDKGVDTEFRTALEQAAEVLSKWKEGELDNKAAYHALYKTVTDRDEKISSRYDGLTGSHYLTTLAQIYAEGQIREEDLKDFSESNRAALNTWAQFYNR